MMLKDNLTPIRAPASPRRPIGESREIQRFIGAERLIHWALALPFTLLYATALLLLATWAEPQPRTLHHWIGWAHRGAGVCLIVFPPLALLIGIRQWKAHFENMREGWWWTLDDFRWLLLFPRAAVDSRITLPEQNKFNAAEKLNFMMVFTTYPLYIATGIWIWMPGVAFLAWIAHLTMAVIGLPLVLGHIFMAAVNPSTRIGITGMITGWVDREWAKHHYRRWYRRRFEKPAPARSATVAPSAVSAPPSRPAANSPVARPASLATSAPPAPAMASVGPSRVDLLLQRAAMVRCANCEQVSVFGSWEQLLQRVFQVEPLFCPKCHAEILVVSAEADVAVVNAIIEHLESDRGHEPFHERTAISA
jgi:formate dehydrogenase gamma subunit